MKQIAKLVLLYALFILKWKFVIVSQIITLFHTNQEFRSFIQKPPWDILETSGSWYDIKIKEAKEICAVNELAFPAEKIF